MKNFLKIAAILFLTSTCQGLFAQKSIKGLTVGDTIPDFELKMINYNKSSARLSDFKGKALIIDFWAPWCAPCIAAFPKLDTLQKEFENVLNILPVTQNNEDYSMQVLNSLKKNKGITFTRSVIDDRMISRAFTHTLIPHYVWMNARGVVVAITGTEEVTRKNVLELVNNRQLNLPVKTDKKIRYANGEPILAENHLITKENLVFRSQIFKYTEALDNTVWQTKNLIRCGNSSISMLYTLAFGKFNTDFLNHSRTVLENFSAQDSVRIGVYRDRKSKELFMNNKRAYLFTYEFIFPESMFSFDEKFEIMQQDLNRFFSKKGIKGRLEDRPVTIWSLVRTTKTDKLKSSSENKVTQFSKYAIKARKIDLTEFLDRLKRLFPFSTGVSIIDESGYRDNVDLDIAGDATDLRILNANLEKYGLKLTEKTQVMPVVVITKTEE